jgi:hypothetical protein
LATASGTNVSVPKKPKATKKMSAKTAGRPAAARSAPAGSNRASDAIATQPPASTSMPASGACPALRPARRTLLPAASATAAGPRRPLRVPPRAGGVPSRAIGAMTSSPISNTGGTSARKTQRQSKCSAMRAASAGPTRPGMIHALDSSATMRGMAVGR